MTWHNDALEGREIGELVRDYVMELGKHLKALIRESAGGKDPGNIPWEVFITVPAIWNDRARDRTRRACQRAVDQINSHNVVHLVSEPEAAAIYSLGGQALQNFQVGDTVVVLDAGGGTVDLISYTITQRKPTIQIQEVGIGSGGVCGSAFLNMQFADLLTKKVGKGERISSNSLINPMEIFEEKV
jgi:molecular chaperone DnaK (HSP70)